MRNDIQAINEAFNKVIRENYENSAPKLYFNDQELSVGDMITDEMGVEEGVIADIRYPEVHVKEINTNSGEMGEEGWTVSQENENMGSLEWR